MTNLYITATTVRRHDPFTIDLDGDGIETVPPSSTDPILFDHESDGGDGNDRIIDTGENDIIIEDNEGDRRTITNVYKTGAEIWTTPDGKVEMTHHSPWQIVLEDGGTIELGSDLVFAENYGEMEALVAAGESAANINARGDLATGGGGNDFIYGSNAMDLLFGGDGHDLIVGGGGDDVIISDGSFAGAARDWTSTVITYEEDIWAHEHRMTGIGYVAGTNPGDDDYSIATRAWSFTITQGASVSFSNVTVSGSAFQGDDVIYAGTGNDFVGAGGDSENTASYIWSLAA